MATQKEKRAARQKVSQFAFPKQRKEPVHDAEHVRNAIARFDQVEVEARDWPDLMTGGKARRRSLLTFKRGTLERSTDEAAAMSQAAKQRWRAPTW